MKLYKKVNILGTIYKIYTIKNGEPADTITKDGFVGSCCATSHTILILDLKTVDDWKNEPEESIRNSEKNTLRHELIHAFLNESGLQWDGIAPDKSWAKNEEMVDWMAIQSPKIFKLFNDLGIL